MENGQKEIAPTNRVKDFTDLETWRCARNLRRMVYGISAKFPKLESFGLASQMRRAAVSVTANIAEDFGRYPYQENIQFCRQARGSVYELRDHFTTALDAEYVSKEQWAALNDLAVSAIRLLNGYIRSTEDMKLRSSNEVRNARG